MIPAVTVYVERTFNARTPPVIRLKNLVDNYQNFHHLKESSYQLFIWKQRNLQKSVQEFKSSEV